MNRVVVKHIIILSLLLGAILGLIAPIPYVGMVTLIIVLLLSAPLVMVYLIMDGKLDLTTTKDSILTGALAGFMTNITYAMAYSLVASIMAHFFNYTSNFILTTMIINAPFWLLLVFVIFVGVLFATINSFSAFVTYYVINLIRDIYEKEHSEYREDDFNRLK